MSVKHDPLLKAIRRSDTRTKQEKREDAEELLPLRDDDEDDVCMDFSQPTYEPRDEKEKKLLAKFKRQMKALDKTIREARKIWPKANLYVEGAGNMCLLSGPSHDSRDKARQDRILALEVVNDCAGGGW